MVSDLRAMGGDVADAIDRISVPSYGVDPTGVIRWLNPAAKALVGDARGRQLTSVVAPEETRRVREHFARNVAGVENVRDADVVLLGPNGERIKVEVSSVRMHDGSRVVGIFGQISDLDEENEARPPHPALTPRQVEILRMLERGKSTQQIADELHLSIETVRNHVRRLLRALGVHTRLEAVALARYELAPLT
jgi:PAS domain S-box-containing protein